MMKKLLLFALTLFVCQAGRSQVLFSEDFDGVGGPTAGGAGTYTFPAGWLLRNVDNRTPNAQVIYVNDAWERREDFGGSVTDSCAFSTSWYNPVGAADDWMWTPLVGPILPNTVLKWNGKAYDQNYPDGYQVRVMTQAQGPPTGGTGAIGNQITNSTQIFTIGAENSTWTSRSVPLTAYVGQSIYIGFNNPSNDMFLLTIDDIEVSVLLQTDVQVVSLDTLSEYTIIPRSQVSPLPLGGRLRYNGSQGITNAQLQVTVFDPGMNQIHTSSSTGVNLAANQVADVTAGTWTPPATPGLYTVRYVSTSTEANQSTTNDTLYTSVLIDQELYARDDGTVTGALGIGTGNGGFLGQDFEMHNAGRLTDIGLYITTGFTGRRLGAVVWNMTAGAPNAIVAATDTILYPDDSARYYTLPIHGGPFNLAPGRYVFTIIEFAADSTVSLGLTNSIFTPNRTWANPQTGWANNEDFGSQFAKTYVIRPSILEPCPSTIIQSTSATPSDCNDSTGTATVLTSGSGPFTYLWSNGQTGAVDTGLVAGSYSVVVTHVNSGCTATASVNIVNPGAPTIDLAGSTITDVLCFGQSTGAATMSISGGASPYAYSWNPNVSTGSSISNVAAGTYTLTVTDANNCIAIETITISEPAQLSGSMTTVVHASCFSCTDGSATVNVTGGVGPYTYSWSPSGGSSATASNLGIGNYTVTVTDANGCTLTQTVEIVDMTAGVEGEQDNSLNIYPNPSNGTFFVEANFPYYGDATIDILDINGKILYSYNVNMAGTLIGNKFEISGVATGTYALRMRTKDRQIYRKLIVK